jgi:hypothetical protein
MLCLRYVHPCYTLSSTDAITERRRHQALPCFTPCHSLPTQNARTLNNAISNQPTSILAHSTHPRSIAINQSIHCTIISFCLVTMTHVRSIHPLVLPCHTQCEQHHAFILFPIYLGFISCFTVSHVTNFRLSLLARFISIPPKHRCVVA